MWFRKVSALLLLALLSLHGLPAYEGGSRDIFFQVAGARDTQPPKIMENKLILTYKPQEPTRFIGAAFKHENYIQTHPFQINDYGVFFLVYPLPQTEAELTYRLVVDGLWIPDPANSRTVKDKNGIILSRLSLPERSLQETASPSLGEGGKVTFRLMGSPGELVYLAGSFNRWDPFMYQMKESPRMPGLYQITLPLNRGTHYYYFIYRGLPITDPRNLDVAMDGHGREVSVLSLP